MWFKWNNLRESDLKWYLIAITPVTSIFFIIPFELYFSAREYWNWNSGIPLSFALSGILVCLMLAAVIGVLFKVSRKFSTYISICLFCLGIFILVADVFSPLQTNLLDGSELASNEPLKYTLVEAAFFAFILLAAIKLETRRIILIGVPLSIMLFLISGVYLCLILIFGNHPVEAKLANRNLGNNIQGNVYHIVLDEMQRDAARLHICREDLSRHFYGFTFFENNISNYLYTDASLPSYLTGSLYSEGGFSDWRQSFKKKGVLKQVFDQGYNIILFSARRQWCGPYVSKCVSLEDIYEEVEGIKDAHYKDFIQIWFARIMPNVFTNESLAVGKQLGRLVCNLCGPKSEHVPLSISEGKEPFSSVLMLKELINTEKMRPADGQYVYAHAVLPHGPYVMDAEGKYDKGLRDGGTAAYYGHVKCAFNLAIEFIEELKRLGRYDKATIVIHADTGHGHRGFIHNSGSKMVGSVDSEAGKRQKPVLNNRLGWTKDQLLARTMALLMIKPAYSMGELRFSERESQLIDLYPTLLDLLKIVRPKGNKSDGFSLFGKDFPTNRSAAFFLYRPGEQDPDMIRIGISNQKDLSKSDLIIEDNARKSSITDLQDDGFLFNIGTRGENSLVFQGFSGRERNSDGSQHWRWAVGKRSKIIFQGLQLREDSSILVTFRVKPFLVNNQKEMTIKTALSGAKVALKPGWNEYSVTLDFPAGMNPVLTMLCEKSASPMSLGINNDIRNLSVSWDKISLKYTE